MLVGFEGFFTALRNRDVLAATHAGLLVGVVSLLVVGGGVIIASALTPPPPPPCLPREGCGVGLGSAAISIGPAIAFAFFLTEGFGAIVVAFWAAGLAASWGSDWRECERAVRTPASRKARQTKRGWQMKIASPWPGTIPDHHVIILR